MRLKMTSKIFSNIKISPRYALLHYLKEFLRDPEYILNNPNIIISGEVLLAALLGETWKINALDLYMKIDMIDYVERYKKGNIKYHITYIDPLDYIRYFSNINILMNAYNRDKLFIGSWDSVLKRKGHISLSNIPTYSIKLDFTRITDTYITLNKKLMNVYSPIYHKVQDIEDLHIVEALEYFNMSSNDLKKDIYLIILHDIDLTNNAEISLYKQRNIYLTRDSIDPLKIKNLRFLRDLGEGLRCDSLLKHCLDRGINWKSL